GREALGTPEDISGFGHGVDIAARKGEHAPNNLAKRPLIPDGVISRTRLRPRYGQGWQSGLGGSTS
ncbi:MAG TPA: hypothetical protein VKP69_35145, partial [Isosphaeraceae bacterium]|nr:hypothetical protein [Isosphaeraceae bacterium]